MEKHHMTVVLLVIALCLFLLASFSVSIGRVLPGWLGLVFLAAAMLVGPLTLLVR
jgi:hypothetical protein